jgi:hypothetical protein
MRVPNVAIALLAGLFLCASAAAAQTSQSVPAGSPHVALSITLPDGKTEPLATHESGLATVTVGGREYGFRPTMLDDEGNRFIVTIFDMGTSTEAVKEIGSVDVKGGGPAVASKTTPGFKVQARKTTGTATT